MHRHREEKSSFGLALSCLFGAVCLIAAATFPPAPVFAGEGDAEEKQEADTLEEAFVEGETKLDLRYRYETVDQDTPDIEKDAHASTLRTVLAYRTLPFHGVSAFLEFEDVRVVGDDLYDNKGHGHLGNDVADRPVVADPEITEVNQAGLRLTWIPRTTITAGRQEILLDNQRFVGAVGWRQNHQSFDAVSIRSTPGDFSLTYAYLANVNRIYGDEKNMNTCLANGSWRPSDIVGITAYFYFLDYDNPDDAGLSTATLGLRVNGTSRLGENWKLGYDGEFARQREACDNPGKVNADYYRAEIGPRYKGNSWGLGITVGQEVLGGSADEGAVTTPLATLHKFNGWADMFLATPAAGLEDSYLGLNARIKAWKLICVYHWFRANEGGGEYGTELDLLASYETRWGQDFGAKMASYKAETHARDTRKVMIFTGWGF